MDYFVQTYSYFPQNSFLISKQIRQIVKKPIDDIKQNLNIQKKLMQKKKKYGIAYIRSTLSNTIITVTDYKGDTKTWSSSGSLGFKGSRRSTNYAAQATAENAARTAIQLGIKSVEVRIKGLGYGKESSLRGLRLGGLIIIRIRDVTPTPHNGCRPPKKRRV